MEVSSNYNVYYNVGLVLVATMLLTKLIIALTTPKSKIKKNLPPVVATFPVVGGLLRFLKGPLKLLKEEYPKLGSVITVNLMHKNLTFLIGPEVSSHFFNAHPSELSQEEVYKNVTPAFGPGVMYDVSYATRQEQFGFFVENLKGARLRSYGDQMIADTREFFSAWGDSGEVDLMNAMDRVIMLTSSTNLLGEEVRNTMLDQVSDLLNDIAKGMPPISTILPNLPIPAHLRRDRARVKLGEIFAKIMADRRKNGVKKNDMIQILMDSKYKDGRPTTDTEVTGMLITILFGGRQTSAITSLWTGAYLLTHKKFMEDALAEQKMLMKKYGDRIDYEVISEMEVLHRCIKEATRLQPPVPITLRYARKDFSVTTREGITYDIPKGHILAASAAFSNRLPYIYKDPDAYDPDRFLPGRDEIKKAGALSYITFGSGRNGCQGEAFSYLSLKTIWSHLLRNYELELMSGFPENEWNTAIMAVKGKVMVRYKARKLPLV